jgi:hypothetical protein
MSGQEDQKPTHPALHGRQGGVHNSRLGQVGSTLGPVGSGYRSSSTYPLLFTR